MIDSADVFSASCRRVARSLPIKPICGHRLHDIEEILERILESGNVIDSSSSRRIQWRYIADLSQDRTEQGRGLVPQFRQLCPRHNAVAGGCNHRVRQSLSASSLEVWQAVNRVAYARMLDWPFSCTL